MINIYFFGVLFTCWSLGAFFPSSAPLPTEQKQAIRSIVIDAGHGGKDPGASGQFSHEKDIALAVALELGRIIQKNMPSVKVIYTRKSDVFVELYKRAKIANQAKADLFISLHCNAVPAAKRWQIKGTETYVMGIHKNAENLAVAKRENAAILKEANYQSNYQGFSPSSNESHILFALNQQSHLQSSLRLAHKIEQQFSQRVKRHSRGVKQAGFVVLAKTAMPSVLVELGFISHPQEEKFLNDALNQVYLASAIFRAIRDYKREIEQK